MITLTRKKVYQLGISRVYLKGHPKAGQATNFRQKILERSKLHTIRPNYGYWKEIEEKVNSGDGILSLREWEGTPYKSKRPEFTHFRKIHVDKFVLEVAPRSTSTMAITTLWINDVNCSKCLLPLALNDGLEDAMDLVQWLGSRDFHGALINWTDHRYQP